MATVVLTTSHFSIFRNLQGSSRSHRSKATVCVMSVTSCFIPNVVHLFDCILCLCIYALIHSVGPFSIVLKVTSHVKELICIEHKL